MKTILSLWALMCLIGFCKSLDRHRNKICYTAMTCIHTGREKCGVDSGGRPRRFYDTCDILEFNCLKGTDYVKTSKEQCQNLPPIDDGPQADNNNVGNNGNNAANKKASDFGGDGTETAIEGTMFVEENGDIETEIVINEDVINDDKNTGLPNNNDPVVNEPGGSKENIGIEGEIELDDNGSLEGSLEINDELVENENQDGPAVDEEVNADDEGDIEGDVKVEENGEAGSAIEGEINVDDDGGIEGELDVADSLLEDVGDNNDQGASAAEGEIRADNEDGVEEEEQVIDNVAVYDENDDDQDGIEGEIVINDEGDVEGEVLDAQMIEP